MEQFAIAPWDSNLSLTAFEWKLKTHLFVQQRTSFGVAISFSVITAPSHKCQVSTLTYLLTYYEEILGCCGDKAFTGVRG